MGANRLQLNAAKTEILWCSSQRRVDQLPSQPFFICSSSVIRRSIVRRSRPGWMDRQRLDHVYAHHQGRGPGCFASLRQLRSVRRSLSHESFTRLLVALVLSRLDYCNGVLAGLPASQLSRLQSVRHSDPRRSTIRPRDTTAAAASLAVCARTRELQTLRPVCMVSALNISRRISSSCPRFHLARDYVRPPVPMS